MFNFLVCRIFSGRGRAGHARDWNECGSQVRLEIIVFRQAALMKKKEREIDR